MRLRQGPMAVVLTVAMILVGCTSAPQQLEVQWQAVSLPMPAGEPGRMMLREVVACEGTWFVLGAIGNASGETRPAAWVSRDLAAWTPVALHPRSYYGERAIFYGGACKGSKLAVLGAKVGGAHGNPRVTTWHQLPDGSLDEVPAEFELYGGPQAVNVSRMAAGPTGWMMTGNRYSGAAVWTSADASAFQIHERVPELASDGRGETWAADLVSGPEGWIVVGGLLGKGRTDRDPMSWMSADGSSWRRVAGPVSSEHDEFQRVAMVDGAAIAVGLAGSAFGVWRLADGAWAKTGTFGKYESAGIPAVRSLATAGSRLLAAIATGSVHEVWIVEEAGKSFRSVNVPVAAPAGAEKTVSVAAVDQRVILLIDDGKNGRAWTADLSVTF